MKVVQLCTIIIEPKVRAIHAESNLMSLLPQLTILVWVERELQPSSYRKLPYLIHFVNNGNRPTDRKDFYHATLFVMDHHMI